MQLNEILNTDFGVCDYTLIEKKLINCRKKADIPENAKSVILFVFPYKVKEEKPKNISRYGAVADYHPIVENKLKEYAALLNKCYPNNKFVPFVDNSPVPEVYAAAAAGLGVVGENGLLITEKYGSFVFIGELVTDLYIKSENKVNACINCGACRKACPVELKKEKCLSAVTQKKKPLSAEEIGLIKENATAWGCDICAEACPMNKNKELTNIQEFIDSYRNEFSPEENPENRPYLWRGKAVIERNYNILNDLVGDDAHIVPQTLPQRKKLRLEDYNYNENGAYFITICTKNRQPILCNIVGDDAHIVPELTEIGKIADKYIKNIPQVTKYVIMPDHIHLILCLDNRDDEGIVPYKSVSNIVRSFKTMVTKEVGTPLFQRSFYDHVIRNFRDYIETFEYIENNPSNWFIKNNP